jgi:hypothetical protein
VRHRGADRGEDRRQIGGDHLVPALVGYILKRKLGHALAGRRDKGRAGVDTGIGEQHVEAAECAGCAVDGRAQRRPVGDVDDGAADIAALGLQLGNCRIEASAIDIEERNARAVVSHDLGISEADAAGATGDHGCPAADVEKFARFHLAAPCAKAESADGPLPEAR